MFFLNVWKIITFYVLICPIYVIGTGIEVAVGIVGAGAGWSVITGIPGSIGLGIAHGICAINHGGEEANKIMEEHWRNLVVTSFFWVGALQFIGDNRRRMLVGDSDSSLSNEERDIININKVVEMVTDNVMYEVKKENSKNGAKKVSVQSLKYPIPTTEDETITECYRLIFFDKIKLDQKQSTTIKTDYSDGDGDGDGDGDEKKKDLHVFVIVNKMANIYNSKFIESPNWVTLKLDAMYFVVKCFRHFCKAESQLVSNKEKEQLGSVTISRTNIAAEPYSFDFSFVTSCDYKNKKTFLGLRDVCY